MSGCVILASERGEVGLVDAMELLRAGASATDAVEAAIRAAESNLEDHYVGVGGIPNLIGELELDASIMDGRTRAVGAVAAVRGYPHPISIARRVLERLPQHALLVGAGAERFAAESGFEPAETVTDEALRLWREGLHDDVGEMGPGERRYRDSVLARLQTMAAPDGPWGTVNVLARDARGHLCVGVSTSGYPWKYPGRVGDSAVVGAGNYCDDRLGGAACTGRGEMAIRSSTALRVLFGLSAGLAPAAACVEALRDAVSLDDDYAAPLQTLVLCPDGRHAGATTRTAGTYAVLTEEMSTYEIVPRNVV